MISSTRTTTSVILNKNNPVQFVSGILEAIKNPFEKFNDECKDLFERLLGDLKNLEYSNELKHFFLIIYRENASEGLREMMKFKQVIGFVKDNGLTNKYQRTHDDDCTLHVQWNIIQMLMLYDSSIVSKLITLLNLNDVIDKVMFSFTMQEKDDKLEPFVDEEGDTVLFMYSLTDNGKDYMRKTFGESYPIETTCAVIVHGEF